jgi:hypothetical protein
MAFTLYLSEFWEKIVFSENQDLEHKVYILNHFYSKIRKEFFKNNFMPFLKDLMGLVRDIEKTSVLKRVPSWNNPNVFVDVEELPNPEILEIALPMLKNLLIEGNKRWNILLESVENFEPNQNEGTVYVKMPNSNAGIFLSYTKDEEKRYIMIKDIGTESTNEWTWDLELEYDIPKETLKHILKEKVFRLL